MAKYIAFECAQYEECSAHRVVFLPNETVRLGPTPVPRGVDGVSNLSLSPGSTTSCSVEDDCANVIFCAAALLVVAF
jgi:hypothetical protein